MKRWFTLFAAIAVLSVGQARAEVATGSDAPDFELTDITGKAHKLSDYRGKTVILEWVNHGCPFVVKHYDSGNMQSIQRDLVAAGAIWLSICSSAEGKQGYYTAEEWQKLNAEKQGAATAVLLDPEGTVGRLYGARTTPHMFVIDAAGKLAYQGAIDNKPSTDPTDIPSALNYVRAAFEDLAAGRAVATPTTKPYGCSVKYK